MQSYKDTVIVKAENNVSEADKNEISQILYYFSRNHKLSNVKYLPKDFKMEQMENVFGFTSEYPKYNYDSQKYFSYISDKNKNPIDIKGYDLMFSIRSYDSAISTPSNIKVNYDEKNHELKISSNGTVIYQHTVSDFGKQIYEKYGVSNNHNIDPNEMSIIDENENMKIKYIFNNINGYEDMTDNITINSMDFSILIGLK